MTWPTNRNGQATLCGGGSRGTDFPEAELMWLEAKQVIRGMDSELYPNMSLGTGYGQSE